MSITVKWICRKCGKHWQSDGLKNSVYVWACFGCGTENRIKT